VATLLDYHGLDPYGLNKRIYDENDGHRHWVDGEIIDRICGDFPPNHLFGLFGTTPGQLGKVLRSAGLEASWVASTNTGKGRQQVWEEVKRSVEATLPVIVSMDLGKLGGRPLSVHWGVIYRVGDSYVHLANTKNITMVPEARFLRAFECCGSCSRASTTAPSSLIRRPLVHYNSRAGLHCPSRALRTECGGVV
jgi:hypothetical protein